VTSLDPASPRDKEAPLEVQSVLAKLSSTEEELVNEKVRLKKEIRYLD
jgi:hypothetical protein